MFLLSSEFEDLLEVESMGRLRKEFLSKIVRDGQKTAGIEKTLDKTKLLLSLEDMYQFKFPLPLSGSPGHNDSDFCYTNSEYSEVCTSIFYNYYFIFNV